MIPGYGVQLFQVRFIHLVIRVYGFSVSFHLCSVKDSSFLFSDGKEFIVQMGQSFFSHHLVKGTLLTDRVWGS